MTRRLMAGIACVFLASLACAADEEPAVQSPSVTQGGERPKTDPFISISAPEDAATIEGDQIKVKVEPKNFNVVDKLGEDPVDGEGHVHFYIDVQSLPTSADKPAVTDDAKTYHAAATTSHTWKGVKPGNHAIGVQLVQNNHLPLDPPVTALISVTVE